MTAPDWTGEHAPGHLPAPPTADSNDLGDRIDHAIRGPILIGLEDPLGTERATEWANHLVTWVMAVVQPELDRLRAEDAAAELRDRVLAYADQLHGYCSPHGVSAIYAEQLRNVVTKGTTE